MSIFFNYPLEVTKVALWVHLHTNSQSLLFVNCIQAVGLICLPDPLAWRKSCHSRMEPGQSLRPKMFSSFCLTFALACLASVFIPGKKSVPWVCRTKEDKGSTRKGGTQCSHSFNLALRPASET